MIHFMRIISLIVFSIIFCFQVQAQVTWTSRASAADNEWTSVTYGNGVFVAVASTGTGNRVMTSPDGITWTAKTSAADIIWTSVTYGNGVFVAVAGSGTGNLVMTSPDGETWTARTSAADNNWTSVTYGNGLFVAVASSGTGNRVMTSPDGISWTSQTSAADNNWTSVTYGNGLFLAVASSGTGNRVMTSPDGISWTSRTSAANYSWQSVSYGNGVFVAVSSIAGENRVMTSSDGITWALQVLVAFNSWTSITFGNGVFVAVASSGEGDRVMTSPNGINWTFPTYPEDNDWMGVTYGNGVFVAVSVDGTGNRVMTSGPIPASTLTIEPIANQSYSGAARTPAVVVKDGGTTLTLGTDYSVAYTANTNLGTATVTITGIGNYTGTKTQTFEIVPWTSRTSAADNLWYGVAYGNGLFVAVAGSGTGNRVMTSPDGITWTPRTSAADADWYGITYGNGLFVAIAGSGTNQVMTSPDGITWTARIAAAANEWRSITYGNGLFVAVGSTGTGNRVMTSPDGITWTSRTSAADNNWGGVAYGNGQFVAVSFDGTDRVMTSPDGITWMARTAAVNNAWYGITYGKGLFVATAIDVFVFTSGSGNRVMTSPDGITWTTRTSAADNTWYTVTYGNGLFVALSDNGTNQVMTSPDGITWTAQKPIVNNAWYGIAYGNGLFVAVAGSGTGDRVMTTNAAVSRLTIDPIASQAYTGSALTPAIVVKDDATTLTLGTHYSVAYSNNTNVGTATATITGMGNFSGTQTVTFSIAVPPPTITSFSPASGQVGSLVTITGTNLGTPTAFTIGGTAAIVISNTATSLVGMVMPGAATGAISLTTAGGSATSAATFTLSAAPAPNTQQGNKLVGTGGISASTQGYSVSLSADGTTAIVGGYNDNSFRGAAWIYTRSGTTWSQEGAKLVGTGGGNFTSSQAVNNSRQGFSVSISADGTTAIVGGYSDNSNRGAVWIFTRSGTTWTQQGNKLVGTGAVGFAYQGHAVSLSADGNTAIVGGYLDNSGKGAAWIFTRSEGTWTQQGNKLVGTGAVGNAQQGRAVSLSADGTTAIVGGWSDNSAKGAAWIFSRSGTTWTQQGAKLVGTGAVGNANQGYAVSLSADGTTAIVGGLNDNTNKGAAWIFTRSGTTWAQQGNKLVGTGAVNAKQGHAVSISADGNTVIVGGYFDNSYQGAAWIYTRNGTTWSQVGDKLVGTGAVGNAYQGHGVSLSADGTTAMVGGGSDNSSQGAVWVYNYVQPPAPTITSFTPTSAATGATVTLTGTNFTGATAVSFGGTSATSFTVVSATSITAVLAAGTSGNVSVTTPGGTGVLVGFTFIPAPVITSFSPSSGPVGSLVTITGTNLGTPTAFTIGGTAAIVISNTGTSLVGMVMPGAVTGTISLTTAGGSATSTGTFTLSAAPAPNAQQEAKLVGTGNTGAANQGYIVSISADGNTAIVGGDTDNSSQGAAWIFTRSGAIWSQQGAKLVGTGAVGNAQQGVAVSLSADGNTAILGGYADDSFQGAAWIFTRSGTTWTQQGAKLVGTGAVGTARQGRAVSLSADGNTAIVSGNFDDSGAGAAWIFTRSGTTWSQQGVKLVGTGAVGNAQQGRAVSLSADGTTAIVGGNLDNSNQGAAWIFTRSGTTWTQQGAKLVGTGAVGAARQGTAVSLSADGTTAILGGITDDSSQGAVWVFTRSGATWTQQGAKLVGTGNTGAAGQGISVSISADGNSAFVGGYNDNSNQGAVWVFTRSGTTWSQRGAKLVGTGNIGAARQGGAVSISADGTTAIVGGYQDNSIQGAAWVYTYVPPPPTLTATGTLAALTTRYATASSNTSFSVSGVYLTNDIIVTAPSGFEVSVSPTSGFGTTVTLTQTSGTVSITTVYVRLKSNSTVAGSPYSGDVTCTSTNAHTINVATVSSTVTALGLTITGVTASNKEYDANLTATLGGTATLVGVVTADQANVTLAGTATATFNNASVETNKAVTVTGYTLGGTAAGNYTVSQPTGLTANITAKAATMLTVEAIANQNFTGAAITPTVVVKDGSTTLTATTDYTVAYSNNTNVGTATVTITGAGNYSGTKTQAFTIVAKAASTLTIDAIANQTYTGSALTPALLVKDGATTLTGGTDYSVAYSNNTNVGTATVTITGIGIYVGTKTQTFAIVAKAASNLSIDAIANQTYTGSALTPAVVVKDGSTTLNATTDYTVAYTNNTNVGTATVTITGTGNYLGTKTQTFTIVTKAASGLTIDAIANQTYTGSALTPAVVVKDGGTTLTLGMDYTAAYSANTNVGTAILTITGTGNYTGTKAQTFAILPKAVNTLSIDPIINQIYTGAEITPLAVVKDGGKILTLATDYTIAYSDNTNAGTARVTITGIGNYAGENPQSFTIAPKALTIQANNASKTYGDANPSLSFTYSGLVDGDTEIDQVPSISTSATTTSGVGTYPITLTGGADPNYSLTTIEGVLEVSPAPLSLAINAVTKIYGQVDPVYTYGLQGLKGSDTETVLIGAFSREAGEDPGSYRISQGSISAGANYNLRVTEASLQILKAKVLSVGQLTGVTTAWSKEAVLPTTVNLLAAHGQNFQVEVKWDKSKLNLLARGTYSLNGTLLLPAGIENPDEVLAKIKVQVLSKPAPREVTIDNNTFSGSTTVFFIPVGAFVVNDPVDNIHVVSFLGEGYDNKFFSIKDNVLYWNSAERAPGKTTFSIVIRVTDRDGNTLDKFFTITRTRPEFSSVTIYNTFTPNGDRFNDTWGVQEIRFYEGARISVYERGGGRVFYTENPDIRWDGTYNGKEMPVGTYFWVIEILETGETRRGMVNVIRK
jgi:gliding motility-associated-like protein